MREVRFEAFEGGYGWQAASSSIKEKRRMNCNETRIPPPNACCCCPWCLPIVTPWMRAKPELHQTLTEARRAATASRVMGQTLHSVTPVEWKSRASSSSASSMVWSIRMLLGLSRWSIQARIRSLFRAVACFTMAFLLVRFGGFVADEPLFSGLPSSPVLCPESGMLHGLDHLTLPLDDHEQNRLVKGHQ